MATTPDPPIGTAAAVFNGVQDSIDKVNMFKDEQANFFTTTDTTATITDQNGNAATVPSYNELKRNMVEPAQTSASVTTPVTAQYTGSLSIAALAILTSVVTSASCRVRLYPTATQRDYDLSRSSSVAVDPGIGLLFEGITTSERLTYVTGANPFLYNGDSPQTADIYYTIEPTTFGSVEVTFNYYPLTWAAL